MPEALKLYLDQMIHGNVARALRADGYDVIRASEVGQSRADDSEILQKAISEDRILITLDEDFGDWAILPLHTHFGVIRLKVDSSTAKNITELLLPFLRMHSSEQFKDYLVILSSKRAKWVCTL